MQQNKNYMCRDVCNGHKLHSVRPVFDSKAILIFLYNNWTRFKYQFLPWGSWKYILTNFKLKFLFLLLLFLYFLLLYSQIFKQRWRNLELTSIVCALLERTRMGLLGLTARWQESSLHKRTNLQLHSWRTQGLPAVLWIGLHLCKCFHNYKC